MTLHGRLAAAALAGTTSLAAASAARPDAPGFTAASVRRHPPGPSADVAMRLAPSGGVVATNATLRQLVGLAWQRHPFDRPEVVGGPDWVDSERYDVEARGVSEHAFQADGSVPETWARLRALLEDRFALKVHEETEDRPVYVLTVLRTGQLGPGLRKTEADCRAAMAGRAPVPSGQGPPCSTKTPPGRLFAQTMTMATIASLLSPHLDRPVVDRTGLAGRFDIELEAAEIEAPPGYEPGPSDLGLPPPPGTPIFVAVQEQLGLKLAPTMAPVPLVVIDRAERPAPE